eukprot:Platyproteum_vivax@DN616_c0_g1_i1.p1
MNLIIFDWDDTLFPTSHCVRIWQGLPNCLLLQDLEMQVHKLLTTAMEHSTIKIVSNANHQWLHLTMSLLPKVKGLVDSGAIEAISARERSPHLPPSIAKTPTFHKLIKNQGIRRLVCIGDGVAENLSAHIMRAYYKIDVCICEIAPKLSIDQLQAVLGKLPDKVVAAHPLVAMC